MKLHTSETEHPLKELSHSKFLNSQSKSYERNFLKVFLKILNHVSITQWNVLDSSLHGFDCGTQEVIVLIETG